MEFITLYLIGAVWMAWREGRLKTWLTPEEGAALRAQWWAEARAEISGRRIIIGISLIALGGALLYGKGDPRVPVLMTMFGMMVISRIAIWLFLALAFVAWFAGVNGHPFIEAQQAMIPAGAAFYAIFIRFIFYCCAEYRMR